MTNPYYDATSSIVPFSRASAAVVQGEFTKIEQGFDGVYSALGANSQSATSTSTVTIGTGSKTFLASTLRNLSAGQFVIVASTASVSNYMIGQISSYNPGTGSLVVSVSTVVGSGTFSDWTISLAPVNSENGIISGQLLVGLSSSSYKADINGTLRATNIISTGNLTTGTTDDNINSGVGVKLRTGGTVASVSTATTNASISNCMYSTGANAYRFYVGYDGQVYATFTAISAISDERMKENIRDLEYGLATILALQPRRFDWKAGKGKDSPNDIGFIAQEVEAVIPELIGTWRGGPGDPLDLKSVKAGELIPVLVQAIKDLAARVEALEV